MAKGDDSYYGQKTEEELREMPHGELIHAMISMHVPDHSWFPSVLEQCDSYHHCVLILNERLAKK